jgi:hypothetical protein
VMDEYSRKCLLIDAIDVVLDNSLSFRTFSVILTYKIWNGVQEINRLPA